MISASLETFAGYCIKGAFKARQFHAAGPFQRGDYHNVSASSVFGNFPRNFKAGCGRLRPSSRYQTSSGKQ